MNASETRFWRQLFDELPIAAPPRLISEYVEGRRDMPTSSPFPGRWHNARTPYGIEIMDDMSPYSPIVHSVTMKARKLGVTAFAENVLGYWMDANPTRVEYVTANDKLAKDWVKKRLEPMINSLGFRHKMIGQNTNRRSRTSGDTLELKEFLGGSLNIVSAGSMMALRSGDFRVLIRDEIDGIKGETNTGEGGWLEVNARSTNSYGARAKVMDFCSPGSIEESQIYRAYLLGDCRKFLVPCPHCGQYQELTLGGENHGIRAETEGGVFRHAYYLCEYCHEAIWDYQKSDMLIRGRWEPTKTANLPNYRSRHISALYSPSAMYSWDKFYLAWQAAKDNPIAMKSFSTQDLGLPSQEPGARPSMQVIQTLRGGYQEFTVPHGAIFLTAGIDLQEGKEKPETPREGPRLEMQILAYGQGYRTWAIGYLVFLGAITDPYGGAWEKLMMWFTSGKGHFWRGERMFPLMKIFVDAGHRPDVVYAFCNRMRLFYPCKGMPQVIADEDRRERGVLPEGKMFYRRAMLSGNQMLYEINTRLYKQIIYSAVSRSGDANREQGAIVQRSGFFDFPMNFPDEYFKSLGSEELLADGSFRKITARNEALDTAVYAWCAQHVLVDETLAEIGNLMKQRGATQWQIDALTAKEAMDYIDKQCEGRLKGVNPGPIEHGADNHA